MMKPIAMMRLGIEPMQAIRQESITSFSMMELTVMSMMLKAIAPNESASNPVKSQNTSGIIEIV
jgi:hypothetical protein